MRNPNISPVRKLKVQRDLDHWRAAERNIRAQPRATKTGGKEPKKNSKNWVQRMLWGLPMEETALELQCEHCLHSCLLLRSDACAGYVQICVSISHQFSPAGCRHLQREHGSSAGAYGNTAGQAKRQSEGQLSKMKYLVLLQLIQTNSSKTSPSSHPAGRTFTYQIHIPLSPQTLSQNHALPKLISETLILKTTFINLGVVDEEMRN